MNAYDCAKLLSGSPVDGFRFSFGVDAARVAAQLRKLADAILADETVVLGDGNGVALVTVEKIQFETTAERDDFTTSKLTMILTEKRKT